MKKKATLFLLAVFAALFPLRGKAPDAPFSPVVRNFSTADQFASRQNWAVSQSPDGLIYVANGSGLLSFDNYSWQTLQMPKGGLVRSVWCAPDGRIYCGAHEEFGFFSGTADGHSYTSLSQEVNYRMQDEEIWGIQTDPETGDIVFQSFRSLFFYDGKSVEMQADLFPLNLLSCEGRLYSQLIGGDLIELSHRGFHTIVPAGDLPSPVVGILQHPDGKLLLTERSGIFQLKDGRPRPWKNEAENFCTRHVVNRSLAMPDGTYVVGTISGGLCFLNPDGRLLARSDMDSHLMNNTVLGLLCDANHNLWVALDDGLSFIDLSSGLSLWSPATDRAGMIYGVQPDGDRFWLATNQGLYRLGKNGTERIRGLEEQTWFVKKAGSRIICGNNRGLYTTDGRLFHGEGGGILFLKRISHEDATYYLCGGYSHPVVYREENDGSWTYLPLFETVRQRFRNIEQDNVGNLWCEHFNGTLMQIRPSSNLREIEQIGRFDSLDGQTGVPVFTMTVAGRVVFCNGTSFYVYDDLKGQIVPYEAMNRQLGQLGRVHQAVRAYDQLWWLVSDTAATLVECSSRQFRPVRSIAYRDLGIPVEDRASLYHDRDTGYAYLCLNHALARIDVRRILQQEETLREVPLNLVEVAAFDKNQHRRDLPLSGNVRIGSRYNSVSFRFRHPSFSALGTEYRLRLEGLSDEWYYPGQEQEHLYYRLRPGKYNLTVEAVTNGRTAASTSYAFSIRRSVFLSFWMILLYAVAGFGILRFFQIRAGKRQDAENEKILAAKEKELLQENGLRLEEDLEKKSRELSDMVMTLVAYRGVMESLSAEINEQRSSGQPSLHGLDKLRRMINDNLPAENELWDTFQVNFDHLHDHFFQRLKEHYPSLTATDLRFCALLRLNLSTKEIADMMNLTVRGVESARFRLRKKFNIAPEESLTNFIIKF